MIGGWDRGCFWRGPLIAFECGVVKVEWMSIGWATSVPSCTPTACESVVSRMMYEDSLGTRCSLPVPVSLVEAGVPGWGIRAGCLLSVHHIACERRGTRSCVTEGFTFLFFDPVPSSLFSRASLSVFLFSIIPHFRSVV